MTLYEMLDVAANGLTPLAILLASVWFSFRARREADHNRKFSELVVKRVELWDKLAFPLNDIYAYFLFVGNWKETGEREVIAAKRITDRIVHAYRPFFSQRFYDAYTAFMAESFSMFGKHGTDAKLRTQNIRPEDQQIAADRFTGEDNAAGIHAAYFALLTIAAEDFDIVLTTPIAPETPRPEQLRDKDWQTS
ncbi:MAG: hypothetical protein ACFB6R_18165 [Alphaproteobacteria bacterium]